MKTLVVFVSFVCVYFGCWEVTNTHGVPAVSDHVRCQVFLGPEGEEFTLGGSAYNYAQPTSPIPFLVTVSKHESGLVDPDGVELSPGKPCGREYYLWFFGYIAPSNVHRVAREDITYW